MSVPQAYVDAAGYHVPSDADILAGLQAAYRGIYGQDIAFDSSDQDTQWLGIIASAIGDANASGLAAYNARSPATAQGTGLSSVVKINGIGRKKPSYSTQSVTVIGQAGTVLSGQTTSDGAHTWTMADAVIPFSGTIDLTATCTVLGAVTVVQGTAGAILQPTRGLQSITFSGVTAPGQPVETDAQLRIRQAQSTMLPSQTVLDGIVGALVALPGVTRLAPYENDDNDADDNGIPAHAISIVIEGGDEQAIAEVIALKKTPGCGTYGTAVATVINRAGVARDIRFFRPQTVTITWIVTVKALAGYTLDAQAAIQQAVSDWTNALGIGTGVSLARAYVPANLVGDAKASTFELIALAAARDGTTTTPVDVPIAFNEAPFCRPDFVQVIASK